jgi:glycosyltransferase involved in cell wall biosynthesis
VIKISIITVCLNVESTIDKCLESIKAQTYPSIEHIIIDGKSSDGTLKIINKYDHVHVLKSEPDEGIYDAMNKGIKYATGDYLYFLNADDYLFTSDVLENFVRNTSINKADIYYGNIEVRNGGVLNYFSPQNEYRLLEGLSVDCLPHQAMFVAKNVFEVYWGF